MLQTTYTFYDVEINRSTSMIVLICMNSRDSIIKRVEYAIIHDDLLSLDYGVKAGGNFLVWFHCNISWSRFFLFKNEHIVSFVQRSVEKSFILQL